MFDIKHIITHANCPDGNASALILKDALPHATVTAVAHGTPEYEAMPAVSGMLFCDIAPPRARAQEFVDAGAVVLDHHVGQRDVVAMFGERGVYANEPGVSGAVLAHREVFWSSKDARTDSRIVRRFAELAGIRDTWQRYHEDWNAACELSAALEFFPIEKMLDWGIERTVSHASVLGPILISKRLEAAKEAAAQAVRFTIRGCSVAVVDNYDARSDAADLTGADITAGFAYRHDADGPKLTWSMRSRGDVDVAAVAKRFGGGGHTKAAGFTDKVWTCPDGSNIVNPYVRIQELLAEAL